MRYYHPELNPSHTLQLSVGDGHTLWVGESGNPDGLPVVVIHGGPGAGSSHLDRRLFDPERYRIIQFDQRGCGESTPHGSLQANTPHHLIADMEVIRHHLGIEQWVCFGGSWGSTLALMYGQAHPDRVLGFVLRGIFLCRQAELDWLYNGGAARVFPDHWARFANAVGNERPLLNTYHRHLTGDDELERLRAAKSWAAWEGLIASLRPSPKHVSALIR
ncbi:MAG: alpha/beta fold hydrolase, partial [Natronospirillum sp.]